MTVEAVVDSNVPFGFRSKRDHWHERAAAIVTAMDAGAPPGQVTNYALPEILNPSQRAAGFDRAREPLDFIDRSSGFEIRHLSREDLARGQLLFREARGVELPDAIPVAYMRRRGLEYVDSFDADFDRFNGITRLDSAVNPFEGSTA